MNRKGDSRMVKLTRLKRLYLEIFKLAVFNECALANCPNRKIYKAVYKNLLFRTSLHSVYKPQLHWIMNNLKLQLNHAKPPLVQMKAFGSFNSMAITFQVSTRQISYRRKGIYLASTNFCEESRKFIGSVSSNSYPLSFLSCNRLIRSHDWPWAKHCTLHSILLKHKRISTILLTY